MSLKHIKVLGYANSEDQFIVNANNLKVRISKNNNNPELEGASPLEYVLAGYAGCINAVGRVVAKEQGLILKALQVEISATLSLDKYQGVESAARAGFEFIDVVVRPSSDAELEDLQEWILAVKKRCPIHDNLLNITPINLELERKYEFLEVV